MRPDLPPVVSARLLSLPEAAEHLHLSTWTLRAWAARGKIGTVKLGTRVLVPLAEVERAIVEGTRPRQQPPPTVLAVPARGGADAGGKQ